MSKKLLYALIALAALTATSLAQIRLCTYNVLNFPGSTGTARIPYFQTVIDGIQPDLLVCQEMLDNAGAQQFFEGVLDTSLYDRAGWVTQGESEYMLYYNQSLFDLVAIHTVLTDLRNWEIYELEYIGGSARPNLYVATSHLKASQGGDNEARRLIECEALIDWLDLNPLAGNNLVICGDFNFYYSDEPGYQALLANSTFIDPIDSPGSWHDNSSFAAIHTQSPRITSFGGGATGGMDDRFDIALITPQLIDGAEWEYSDGSYTAYGNDGLHFNQAINNPPNQAVPANVADALHEASDHLPVFFDMDFIESSPLEITLTPLNPPVQIPASGGNLYFDLFVDNFSTTPLDYEGWLAISYEGGTPNTVVYRSFTNFQPSWVINRPGTYYPISATYASGNYDFIGKVGEYPSNAWDEDSFTFVKLGNDAITGFVPFAVDGAPNPFDMIQTDILQTSNFKLITNYPNPFNPTTTISYQLPIASYMTLRVFDVQGREVATLADGFRSADSHEVTFDGSSFASGIYIYRLKAGEFNATGKMVLMK